MGFGTFAFALGIIGLSVYFVAQANDEAGWWYIAILLLGLMLTQKNFASQLYQLGFPQQTGTAKATPGQGGQ